MPVPEAYEQKKGHGFTKGRIKVAHEVVSWIAALAATEVDGVEGLYQPSGRQGDRILKPHARYRGVRVKVHEDLSLVLDLYVAVSHDAHIPTVGAAIQREVAKVVQRMLELRVREVNVLVREVVFV